tara:strand:+ start:154 stop:960 length:807 start_codon:yes stop_codon:yes gene_type:complete
MENDFEYKNLHKRYKRHLELVRTNTFGIGDSYIVSEFIDILYTNSFEKYILTNNALIGIRNFNVELFGEGKLYSLNKEHIREIIESQHSFERDARKPHYLNSFFLLYNLRGSYLDKCYCFKDRLYFDWIDSIEILNKRQFMDEYSYVKESLSEDEKYYMEKSYADSNLTNLLLDKDSLTGKKISYVRINMKNSKDIDKKYDVPLDFFNFKMETTDYYNSTQTIWRGRQIGFDKPEEKRSTNIVIILEKDDADKFKETLDTWKKSQTED